MRWLFHETTTSFSLPSLFPPPQQKFYVALHETAPWGTTSFFYWLRNIFGWVKGGNNGRQKSIVAVHVKTERLALGRSDATLVRTLFPCWHPSMQLPLPRVHPALEAACSSDRALALAPDAHNSLARVPSHSPSRPMRRACAHPTPHRGRSTATHPVPTAPMSTTFIFATSWDLLFHVHVQMDWFWYINIIFCFMYICRRSWNCKENLEKKIGWTLTQSLLDFVLTAEILYISGGFPVCCCRLRLRLSAVAYSKWYSKALEYEYKVKTAALDTLKWYSILSLTLYLE
jgi:hypothetical protein